MAKIIRKLNKNSKYSYSINIPKDVVKKMACESKMKKQYKKPNVIKIALIKKLNFLLRCGGGNQCNEAHR
ncbi:hypothetical protein D4R87_03320 [bacterium]|nr:MAG: hypothetical protein D4R87_03320 [bacterium]